jgi:polyisoprenoid-binding protein YceI
LHVFFRRRLSIEIFKHTMKRIFKLIPLAFFSLIALFSCKNEQKPAQETQVTAVVKPDTIRLAPLSPEGAATFEVTEGEINWLGKRTFGNRHTGTVKVAGGELKVKQGRLLSGKVVVDMSSIKVDNVKDPGARADLESHLKDTDFFEVKKYPTSEFVFKEVLPSNKPDFNWVIVGNLTMKDTTNSVNIPVKLKITEDELSAESANFTINRLNWNVKFQSGMFGTAKNKIIEDIVPLSLTLKAQKRSEK